MHDIRAIRENAAAFQKAWSRRSGGVDMHEGRPVTDVILEFDAEVRKAIQQKEEAEAARNALSKQIGQAKAKGDNVMFESLRGGVDAAKQVIEQAGASAERLTKLRDDLLARLPNLPLEDVPDGKDEHANKVMRTVGTPRQFNFQPKDHADIGEGLKMMDFEAAARMSGARFVVLKGQLARMERALAAFMLDVQTGENGYSETSVPLLVNDKALMGTGQLPKFAEDLFTAIQNVEDLMAFAGTGLLAKFSGPDALDLKTPESAIKIKAYAHYVRNALRFLNEAGGVVGAGNLQMTIKQLNLIPTSEVSLTNIVREQILDGAQLPMRMTAATPCFRSEAGSAGRDTKGMIRMHQFIKVELVSITKPEDSDAELERMTKCAEGILERLELPYRTMMLCAGDMGFGARKTYDLEVWLPSQNTYREISSCSTCGDFQARRMDARFRRGQGEKPEFVHTLNGSGLAVGRTLVAILENYQQEDGKVRVPAALVPYMGGLEVIG